MFQSLKLSVHSDSDPTKNYDCLLTLTDWSVKAQTMLNIEWSSAARNIYKYFLVLQYLWHFGEPVGEDAKVADHFLCSQIHGQTQHLVTFFTDLVTENLTSLSLFADTCHKNKSLSHLFHLENLFESV